jgi:hypothetical protein
MRTVAHCRTEISLKVSSKVTRICFRNNFLKRGSNTGMVLRSIKAGLVLHLLRAARSNQHKLFILQQTFWNEGFFISFEKFTQPQIEYSRYIKLFPRFPLPIVTWNQNCNDFLQYSGHIKKDWLCIIYIRYISKKYAGRIWRFSFVSIWSN